MVAAVQLNFKALTNDGVTGRDDVPVCRVCM